MSESAPQGHDDFGRRVHLLFSPRFDGIQNLSFPEGSFVVLIGGPTLNVSVDEIYATAEVLLQKGAVYIMCWGQGAQRLEDIIDEADAMKSIGDSSAGVVMTTAHEHHSLGEVLEFATTMAIPAAPLARSCQDVVLIFHGNVNPYNEAHNLLEDMLSPSPRQREEKASNQD